MAEESPVLRRRHSAQLKAQVLAECAEPGALVAKVAMSHALNANIVHRWRKLARERDGVAAPPPPPSPASLPVETAASIPQFVPVSMAPTPPESALADIRIELRRGATAVKLTWPIAAAAECAAWMRELLR